MMMMERIGNFFFGVRSYCRNATWTTIEICL